MQFDADKLVQYFSDAPEDISLSDINLETIPPHVSIIMDGNGRWATARGLDRTEGHKAGVLSLREAVTTSVRLGLDVLSVYAFSTENCACLQRRCLKSFHCSTKKTLSCVSLVTLRLCQRRLARPFSADLMRPHKTLV